MTAPNAPDQEDVAALRHLIAELQGHIEMLEGQNRLLLAENFKLRNETSYG